MTQLIFNTLEDMFQKLHYMYGNGFFTCELFCESGKEDIACEAYGLSAEASKLFLLQFFSGGIVRDENQIDIISSRKRFEHIRENNQFECTEFELPAAILPYSTRVDIHGRKYIIDETKNVSRLMLKNTSISEIEYSSISERGDCGPVKLDINGNIYIPQGEDKISQISIALKDIQDAYKYVYSMKDWADSLLQRRVSERR